VTIVMARCICIFRRRTISPSDSPSRYSICGTARRLGISVRVDVHDVGMADGAHHLDLAENAARPCPCARRLVHDFDRDRDPDERSVARNTTAMPPAELARGCRSDRKARRVLRAPAEEPAVARAHLRRDARRKARSRRTDKARTRRRGRAGTADRSPSGGT
jgi:hypothetical protein